MMDFLSAALRPSGRDRVRNVEEGLSGSTRQFPHTSQTAVSHLMLFIHTYIK